MKKSEEKKAEETEVVEVEVLVPERGEPAEAMPFVTAPPAIVQEAIAGEALLEIKNSLDAVHLHHTETILPQDQSMVATYHIARAYLQDAVNVLKPLDDAALTPSVRGWRVVASGSLERLKEMGVPDHEKSQDLIKVAKIVTEFLEGAHLMLSQTTKNSERRKLAGRILAGINKVPLLGEGEKDHVN